MQIQESYPCGFCRISSCGISLTYGSTRKVKYAKSKCVHSHKLSVNSEANLMANLPSTNRPIKCPMFSCDQVYWTYNFNQHYLDCHPGVLPSPEVKPLEAEQVFILLGATAELPISNKRKHKCKCNSTAPHRTKSSEEARLKRSTATRFCFVSSLSAGSVVWCCTLD